MFGFKKTIKDEDRENVYALYLQKCEQVDFLSNMMSTYEDIVKHLHCCIEHIVNIPQNDYSSSTPPIHVTTEDFVKIMSDFMPSLDFDPESNG